MEQLERALLRLEARLDKVLERLLARRRGAAAYNATVLVLLEVVAGQTAGRVVRRAVPDLRTGANTRNLGAASLQVVIALILTRAIRHIGFYLNRRFFSSAEQVLSLCVFALRTVLSIHVSRSANSSVGSRERACCREIEDR
jgi:hypothetical protein